MGPGWILQKSLNGRPCCIRRALRAQPVRRDSRRERPPPSDVRLASRRPVPFGTPRHDAPCGRLQARSRPRRRVSRGATFEALAVLRSTPDHIRRRPRRAAPPLRRAQAAADPQAQVAPCGDLEVRVRRQVEADRARPCEGHRRCPRAPRQRAATALVPTSLREQVLTPGRFDHDGYSASPLEHAVVRARPGSYMWRSD